MGMSQKKHFMWSVVFILVASMSCKQPNESKPSQKSIIGEELVLPTDLLCTAGMLLYIEGHTCVSCLEKELLPLWGLLSDSFPTYHPIVLIHSNEKKLPEIELFHKRDSTFHVIVSNTDSIRYKNEWIPEGRIYYGFILDSLGIVKSYGFISNESFINSCYKYCKNNVK